MVKKRMIVSNVKGQAILETLLLLSLVFALFFFIMKNLQVNQYVQNTLLSPLQKDLKSEYRYGSKGARGWDEGTPQRHIRMTTDENDNRNFRIFQEVREN